MTCGGEGRRLRKHKDVTTGNEEGVQNSKGARADQQGGKGVVQNVGRQLSDTGTHDPTSHPGQTGRKGPVKKRKEVLGEKGKRPKPQESVGIKTEVFLPNVGNVPLVGPSKQHITTRPEVR